MITSRKDKQDCFTDKFYQIFCLKKLKIMQYATEKEARKESFNEFSKLA